jgi:hypothetical protein
VVVLDDTFLLAVRLAVARAEDERGAPLPTGDRADRVISELAARQHQVVLRRQLLVLGVSGGSIDARIGARLRPVHRGTFAVDTVALTAEGRRLAALLTVGRSGALSHRSLAHLLGVWAEEPDPVEVSVPGRAGRRRRTIRVHRVGSLDDVDRKEVGDVPCTTVARMVVDLAGVLTEPQLAEVLRQLDRTGRLDVRAVEDVLRRVDRPRGVVVLRALLRDYDDAPSVPFEVIERRWRALARRHGLPAGEPQAELRGTTRRADALLPGDVVLELDGRATHERLAQVADDRRRDLELAALGYLTVRLTWDDVTTRAAKTAERLRSVLLHRSA